MLILAVMRKGSFIINMYMCRMGREILHKNKTRTIGIEAYFYFDADQHTD